MGKVIMSGVSKGMTVPVPWTPPAAFADASWSDVIRACQMNVVPDTWVVGDQKVMNIGGTDYLFDIIGKNHDSVFLGPVAPLTFQMHDCYATTYPMNPYQQVNSWGASEMNQVYLPEILALMPIEVQNGIREVNKYSVTHGTGTEVIGVEGKLFLLSEVEVFGTTTNSKPGEGSQYAYYAAGNSKVKNYNGVPMSWSVRSPVSGAEFGFCGVSASGATCQLPDEVAYGLSFAFCF